MKKVLLLCIMAIALLSACDTNSIKSKVWHEMSRESLKQDSLENALVLVNLAIGADSTNIDHYFLKAMVASKLHHIDLLNEQVGRLKKNNYKQDSLYYYMGECYIGIDKDSTLENGVGNHTTKLPLAIEAYKACLAMNPNFEKAYENILYALYNSQDFEGLSATCNTALNQFPSNPIFRVYKAASLISEGKSDESNAMLTQLLDEGKLDNIYQSRCYRLIATNYMLKGDFEGAYAPMSKAVDTAPKDYLNFVARADLNFFLNKMDRVCEDYNKALKLGYTPAADSLLKYCPTQTVSDN